MAEVFRVGLAGAGTIAKSHAEVLRGLPGVKVTALAEAVPERGRAFAAEHGIETVYTDWKELIGQADLDAVVVCAPNFLHAPVAVAAMKAGKHVLVEKPMARTGTEAAEMVEVARQTGRTLMVALNNRYRADVGLLKEYAARFGEIYYGRCGWFRRRGIPGWGSWFTRMETAGGGPMVDIGVHMLDMCLYLMGYPEPVSVTGSTYAKFGPHKKGLGTWGIPDWNGYYDVEDLASAMVHFENGATVLLEVSWALNTGDRNWVEVMGTEGGLSLSDSKATIYSEQFGRPVDLVPSAGANEDRLEQARHFVHCCRTGETPLTSPRHGLILNRIFDAVYESGKNGGRQVRLDR
jgi:predicted dehydrogenase